MPGWLSLVSKGGLLGTEIDELFHKVVPCNERFEEGGLAFKFLTVLITIASIAVIHLPSILEETLSFNTHTHTPPDSELLL